MVHIQREGYVSFSSCLRALFVLSDLPLLPLLWVSIVLAVCYPLVFSSYYG
jgi:hypothetical protein